MAYQNQKIADASQLLLERFGSLSDKSAILRAPELRALYGELPGLPAEQRAAFGRELNQLKAALTKMVNDYQQTAAALPPIDVTAPWDVNTPPGQRPGFLPAAQGSMHPLMAEIDYITGIFGRMGYRIENSRLIDNDFNMFEALNFPAGHPARDDYDTFMTAEGLIAPAHTSTMQHRILRRYAPGLARGEPIAAVIPGRVFRNEDLDARHEHTFYQLEGLYVQRGVTAGNLIATLQVFLETYFGQALKVKTQPYYFPFTEPSFEFAVSCPFCDQAGCSICSRSGWIELLGCGLIHPNVLAMAGIDPKVYSGFAWGVGIDRLVLIKHDIEDIRHFESGKLEFLRQFA